MNEQDPLGIDESSEKMHKEVDLRIARSEMREWLATSGHKLIEPDEKTLPPEWICKDFLTLSSSAELTAKPKKGKSALTLDLAIGAASGTGAVRTPDGGWLFDFEGKVRPVFYLDTENPRGLALARFRSLCAEKGVQPEELLRSGVFMMDALEVGLPPPFLAKHEEGPDLKRDLEAAGDFGARLKRCGIQLLVLDVKSHCYQEDKQGRDENAQGFLRDFTRIVNALMHHSGACVLQVHHHRKGIGFGSEMGAGSSQAQRTAHSLLSLSEDPETGLLFLDVEGRMIRSSKRIWMEAGSTADEGCRLFKQVPQPERERKGKGRPKGGQLDQAVQVLSAAVEKFGPKLGSGSETFTLQEWRKCASSVSEASEKTLKAYLSALVGAGKVEQAAQGLYKIAADVR